MSSTLQETASSTLQETATPPDQPIERIRNIRDDLQARVTALLRHLNI